MFPVLNRAGFLERGVGAVLLDGLETLHRNINNDGLAELGDVDTAFLEVGLAADLPGGVKLGRAGAVRIPPAHLRAFPGDVAGACHKSPHGTIGR